jgi:DNA-binding MarR family transcriptional regulator
LLVGLSWPPPPAEPCFPERAEKVRSPLTITPDQVIQAAQELGQDDFTRGDIAEQLGVPQPEMKESFKTARKAGLFEKVRDDEDGKSYFRLTGE